MHKIGVTTNSFHHQLLSGELTFEQLIKWISLCSLQWLEVRDVGCALNMDDLHIIEKMASSEGLEAHLAWDGTDMCYQFNRGDWIKQLDKAALFGGGRYSRVTISPASVNRDAGGYSHEDFKKIMDNLSFIMEESSKRGVRIVLENSFERITPHTGFSGICDVLKINPSVQLCLDYSNFMNKDQVRVRLLEADIHAFLDQYSHRVPYVHIKSTVDNKLIDWFAPSGDIDFARLVKKLDYTEYWCIELPAQDDMEELKKRIVDVKEFLSNAMNDIEEIKG